MIATTQPKLYPDNQFAKYHADGLWGQRLLVDYLDEQAAKTPGKAAIIEAHRTLTYQQVARFSENVAAWLAKSGIGHGDVVAIQAPNWAELPIVHFAANRIGAIFLPLSVGFRERELFHLIRLSRARVVFGAATPHGAAQPELVAKLGAALFECPQIVTLRAAPTAPKTMSFDAIASDDSWRSDFAANWLTERRSGPDEASHVMVSSGTTGLPKCSLFSDNNTIVKILRQYVEAAKVTSEDVAAALAPAGTGSTGYNYPILAMLLVGGTTVLLDHWNSRHVEDVLDLMHRHACTTAVVVPAQLAKLVQVAESEGTEPPALRVITSSGAKLPSSVAASAERVFSCKVQAVYGSSEAGAAAMTRLADPDAKRRDTVGRQLEGQLIQIRDPDGIALPAGEVGEVCWRGANKSYGFLNDPEATANVWDAEGWLRSGDLGKLDDDGYLHIVGRLKDMIIRGGQNVNPGAIEEALLSHPAVSEVAIVPFDDSILGERVGACVVARGDSGLSLESLKALVLEKGMAAWNQPELLVLLDELPRNAGGKIDKKALRVVASAAASHKE